MAEDVWEEQDYHETYLPCTCHTCGKVFVPPVRKLWAYQQKSLKATRKPGEYTLYFCSWGCLRAFEKTFIPPKNNRGRKKEATA